MKIAANDPNLSSWVPVLPESDFPIQNLPFGIFINDGKPARVGVAIGAYVVDMYALNAAGFLQGFDLTDSMVENRSLNELLQAGKLKLRELRNRISELLRSDNEELQHYQEVYGTILLPMENVEMLMPVQPGDYTDFYSSIVHATNVGSMFRPDNPLLPNWKHLPVGYHGRTSSIVVSGQPFHRPMGQMIIKEGDNPLFGPTKQLDFELEMAFITFDGKPMGQRISTAEADDYIFGMVIFNDWSARDIQRWEYVPLGPFLAKNFASSISPWVVTLDALEPFRIGGEKQEPEVLPYLKYNGHKHLDIHLEVYITPEGQQPHLVCESNYKHMYWTMEQQLAHQTVNGCNVRAGDMYASGTISAPHPKGYGSMLELTWRGTKPITMNDGTTRSFIEDGDTVTIKAWSQKHGIRVGFGEVTARVLPAIPFE